MTSSAALSCRRTRLRQQILAKRAFPRGTTASPPQVHTWRGEVGVKRGVELGKSPFRSCVMRPAGRTLPTRAPNQGFQNLRRAIDAAIFTSDSAYWSLGRIDRPGGRPSPSRRRRCATGRAARARIGRTGATRRARCELVSDGRPERRHEAAERGQPRVEPRVYRHRVLSGFHASTALQLGQHALDSSSSTRPDRTAGCHGRTNGEAAPATASTPSSLPVAAAEFPLPSNSALSRRRPRFRTCRLFRGPVEEFF